MRSECRSEYCGIEMIVEVLYWCLYLGILDMDMGLYIGGETGDVHDRQARAVTSLPTQGCLLVATLMSSNL